MMQNIRIWIYLSLTVEVFLALFLLSRMFPLRNIGTGAV